MIEHPTYYGKVYFDDQLDTYEVYGSSYLHISSKEKIPPIILDYKISDKKIINIKYTDEDGQAYILTYIKGKKNILKIFKQQWIKVKVVETEEEATRYLKELFDPYKESYPELWKEPNRFDFSSTYKYLSKLLQDLDLWYLDKVWYISPLWFYNNWWMIVLPIQFKNGDFVSLEKNSFSKNNSDYWHFLISDFSQNI